MDAMGAGIKEFNTGSSQINTPDLSPDTFEYVFTETGEAGNLVATETFEDVEYSTLTEMELNTANDQDITIEIEEPKQEAPHQEVERVSVIVPVVSQQFRIEPLEVKTENLTEDEKYRRMRDQNNEASKRCRANRKRKHQETDEELERLQQRNVVLRAQMDQMEREVKELKSKFLSDITISKKFN